MLQRYPDLTKFELVVKTQFIFLKKLKFNLYDFMQDINEELPSSPVL